MSEPLCATCGHPRDNHPYRHPFAGPSKDDTIKELEAKLAKAVEALRKLHHAVCGETGFAACVRLDSGLAYPWPALDEADEMTRATLAEIEGD
jgi:hypothetical protein